jgi:arsenite-transporting ATPase
MARLMLFGGKGGVGKTTSSAATAIWLADSGYRVLLVSSDPAHSTSDSLEYELGSEPTPVEGVDNLWGLELDPAERMSELLPKLSAALEKGLGGNAGNLLGQQASEGIAQEMSGLNSTDLLLPGLDEALAFDKLLSFAQDPRFDALVFDTAPTGHTLRFLGLPEIIDSWAGRIIRIARLTGGIRSILMGRHQERAMQEELDKFKKRVAHVRRVLTNPSVSSFTLVTIPEQMAVSETKRAAETLTEFDIDVNGIIVNRITPDYDHPFIQKRRESEQKHLSKLREEFSSLPIAEVPLEENDVHGFDALRSIGNILNGELVQAPTDMTESIIGKNIPFSIRKGLNEKNDGSRLVVSLHLPGINREELSVSVNNGELIIGANGKEFPVKLNHQIKSDKHMFELHGDILEVTMEI